MPDRVVAFVECIQGAPGILPKELAEQIGVSVRTLRKYVRYANEQLKDFACIKLLHASGYVLELADEDAYREWVAKSHDNDSRMPQTPDERVLYIMNDLLTRADWVRLEDLASSLFVSRSVVSTDLKSVKRRLAAFELALESKPHHGIRIAGDEMSRRLCLANTVLEMTDDSNREEGVAEVVGFGTKEQVCAIAECVREVLRSDDLSGGGGTASTRFHTRTCSYTSSLPLCACGRAAVHPCKKSSAGPSVRPMRSLRHFASPI